MHTKKPSNGHDADPLLDMGYETRDVNLKGIRNASIVFFGFTFACLAVVYVWFVVFGPGRAKQAVQSNVQRTIPADWNKENPPLQTNVTAKSDMMAIRQEETRRLTGTGWVDQSKGIVHIPIDQAIDAVASGRVKIETGRTVPATNPGTLEGTLPSEGVTP